MPGSLPKPPNDGIAGGSAGRATGRPPPVNEVEGFGAAGAAARAAGLAAALFGLALGALRLAPVLRFAAARFGPAFFAPMRLDEFVPTRVTEIVVHGMDLTDALGRPPLDLPKATPIAAEILDEVLARVKVPGRPADLVGDDLAFIRAAAGRGEHPDPRLPVVG